MATVSGLCEVHTASDMAGQSKRRSAEGPGMTPENVGPAYAIT